MSTTRSFTPPRQRKQYIPRESRLASGTSSSSLNSLSSSSSHQSHKASTLGTSPEPSMDHVAESSINYAAHKLVIETQLRGMETGEDISPVSVQESFGSTSSRKSSLVEQEENQSMGFDSDADSMELAPGWPVPGSSFVENLEHDVSPAELQAFLYGTRIPSDTPSPHFLVPSRRYRQRGQSSLASDSEPSPFTLFVTRSGHSSEEGSAISPISPLPMVSPSRSPNDRAEKSEIMMELPTHTRMALAPSRPGPSRSSTNPEQVPTLRTISELSSSYDPRRQSIAILPVGSSSDAVRRFPGSPSKPKRPLSSLFRRPSSSSSRRSSITSSTSTPTPVLVPSSPRKARLGTMSKPTGAVIATREMESGEHRSEVLVDQLGAPSAGRASSSRASPLDSGSQTAPAASVERRESSSGWKKLWGAVAGTTREPSPPRLRRLPKVSNLNLVAEAGGPVVSPACDLVEITVASTPDPISAKAGPGLPIGSTLHLENGMMLKEAVSPSYHPEIVQPLSGILSRSGSIISVRVATSRADELENFAAHAYLYTSDVKHVRLDNEQTDAQRKLDRRRTMVSARLGQTPKKAVEGRRNVPAGLQRRHTAPMPIRGAVVQLAPCKDK